MSNLNDFLTKIYVYIIPIIRERAGEQKTSCPVGVISKKLSSQVVEEVKRRAKIKKYAIF